MGNIKYSLKYTSDSWNEILKRLKLGVKKEDGELVEKRLKELDLEFMSVFLSAGLKWEHPKITENDVRFMLILFGNEKKKLKKWSKKIVKAMKLFLKGIDKAILLQEKQLKELGKLEI